MPPDFLSKEEVDLLKRTLLSQYPEDEKETFIRICQRTKLDPFTKQIYATKRYQKVRDPEGNTRKVPTLVPVTGIIGLCAVAERTGKYNGCEIFWAGKDLVWKSEWLEEAYPEAAKCIVHHKDRKYPEVGIARWGAYVGQVWNYENKQWEVTDFWARMPDHMIAKCSKALALRGAFPDPLSNVYIREELDSSITESDTEAIPSHEAKVAESQRHEDELKKTGLFPGAKFVDQKPDAKRPAPAEALEPAFEEDKIPPPELKPTPPSKPKAQPAPAQTPDTHTPPEDDLDMGSPEAPRAEDALTPPLATDSPAGGAETPAEKVEAPWKSHVILGVTHAKFHKRKVGDLGAAELGIIESQWLPAVREQWDDASDAQRADAAAFESAIAYQKMVKPW
jgi:phage recombination protein Bet